jgi:hypothetical protein
MKKPMLFKGGTMIRVLFLGMLAYSSGAFAQSQMVLDRCTEIRSLLVTSGDQILIRCDTAYVLNAVTFRLYDQAYRDLRKKASSVTNLINTYDEIISLQEIRLREQEASYSELRASFDALSGTSALAFEQASRRLEGAVGEMDSLDRSLAETNRLLAETQDIIETERRGLSVEKLLWGTAGLAVGMILGVVIAR